MHRSTRAALCGLFPALAASALLAGTAHAGVVTHDPATNTFTYIDENFSDNNRLTVTQVGTKLIFEDTAPQQRGSDRCSVAGGKIECQAIGSKVKIFTQNGNDIVDYRAGAAAEIDLGGGGDRYAGGHRETSVKQLVRVSGGADHDMIDWFDAQSAISVGADDNSVDGTFGENLLVSNMETYIGTPFDDVIFASPRADVVLPGTGNDTVAGGEGVDLFVGLPGDGTDDWHGGPGSDGFTYLTEQGVDVTLDNVANDGVPFERDNIRSNVENIAGGSGDDTIVSFGAHSNLLGGQGNDRLDGGDGPDTMNGGPGTDTLLGGLGDDSIDAKDGERDTIVCDQGRDTAIRDAVETKISGCESSQVGVLQLADTSLTAKAGKPSEVNLSWEHPKAWRHMKSITLSVQDGPAQLGTVKVSPQTGDVVATGALKAKPVSPLRKEGRKVSAKLAVKFDSTLAGRKLTIDVEGQDVAGNRQHQTAAATLQIGN